MGVNMCVWLRVYVSLRVCVCEVVNVCVCRCELVSVFSTSSRPTRGWGRGAGANTFLFTEITFFTSA